MTIRNITRAALVIIALAIGAGCGDGSKSPTSATTTGVTVSDVHGQYAGTYAVSKCIEDGVFVGFCDGSGLSVGTVLPIALSLTQNQSAVTGTVTLGSVNGTFQGTVSGGTISGTAVMTDLSNQGTTVSANIPTWNTTISGNALSGGFSVVFRVTGSTGSATFNATIAQLTR